MITKMVSVVRFMGLVARKYTTEAMTCQRMTQALASAWDWFQVSTASPMGRAKRSTVKIQKVQHDLTSFPRAKRNGWMWVWISIGRILFLRPYYSRPGEESPQGFVSFIKIF